MPPNTPYISPSPPNQMPPSTQLNGPPPDYGFLNEQPKKSFKIPFVGNSLIGRIVFALVVLLLLIIIIIIIKGIFTTAPFNKNDYLLIAERQGEILHILSTDISQTTIGQLSVRDQNFVATAGLSLTTAQSKTLVFLYDYKDTVSPNILANAYIPAIDNELKNSLSINNFDNTFNTIMKSQLDSYINELKVAYNSTNVSNGKSLLKSEYVEAKLLLTSLNTTS